MNYAKPAITLIQAAKSTIQGSNPKQGVSTDSQTHMTYVTAPAYEADE